MNDQAIEQEIQAKGKIAPRITPADIEANIADERYFTAWQGAQLAYWGDSDPKNPKLQEGAPDQHGPLSLLTFCVLVLRNGFTVTGESACASPENFDAEIGRNIARQNAVQKVWPLMGYQLRDQLHNLATMPASTVETRAYADGSTFTGTAPLPDLSPDGAPALPPHQQRVFDEKRDLDEKLDKLGAFFDTKIFAGLDETERQRLERQEEAMLEYSAILGERIEAFGLPG